MNTTKTLSNLLNQMVIRLTTSEKLDTQTVLQFEDLNEIITENESVLIGYFASESALQNTIQRLHSFNIKLKSYERI